MRTDPKLWCQGTHVNECGDAGPERSGREIGRDTRRCVDAEVSGCRPLAGQHEFDPVGLLRVQPQSGAMQPPVKRVEHGVVVIADDEPNSNPSCVSDSITVLSCSVT